MKSIRQIIDDWDAENKADAIRWSELNNDLCQICLDEGPDMRSLFVDCFYQVKESVPEAINLSSVEGPCKGRGYYLRICKGCRGEFLEAMKTAFDNRRALRGKPMDSDGCLDYSEPNKNIPVRVNGAVVMMNEIEWREYSHENS